MITYHESLELIFKKAGQMRSHLNRMEVPIEQALGHVLAESLESHVLIPPFTNSAMDGFALRCRETEGITENPKRFKVVGSIAAGAKPSHGGNEEYTAWEIMTGAPIPSGYDCVARVEDVTVEKDGANSAMGFVLSESVRPKQNVRFAGEDFQPGSHVLSAGTRIEPQHILAVAGIGTRKIRVWQRPKIAILSTGTEIVDFTGGRPEEGHIRNSTAPFLLSELRALGTSPRYYGIVSDSPEEFFKKLDTIMLDNPDVIITTGAVSMGRYDFITQALKDLNAEIIFHKVAIRPGKPILFARWRQSIFFGLPGNPVSTVVGVRFFIEPYLRELLETVKEEAIKAQLENDVKKPEGLRCFFKARMEISNTGAVVGVLPGQASFMVSPLLRSNAWAILPEEGGLCPKGSCIDVLPLHFSSHWVPSETSKGLNAALNLGGPLS